MAWRVAKSLETLRAQLNRMAPNRSKVSDGGIGDAAHATRDSDHNPWIILASMGIVSARDYTHDPQNGLDCEALYQALVKSRDPRIKYIIWNRTITSGARGPQPWVRRKYTGSNPHVKHLHLSVEDKASLFDDAREWNLNPGPTAAKPAPAGHAVTGAIAEAYNRVLPGMNGATWAFFIGKPKGPAVVTWAKDAFWQEFEKGAIYAYRGAAHVLWGDILKKFWELGAETKLGYPVSDELACPDLVGRMNHFVDGPHGPSSIYWSPLDGAHPVWGWFREEYAKRRWEAGELGYPTTDEVVRDGVTMQHFQRGTMILRPDHVEVVLSGS